MRKPDSPCKGCVPPKRNATCHCTCQGYLDYLEEKKVYQEWFNREIIPKLTARDMAISHSYHIQVYMEKHRLR